MDKETYSPEEFQIGEEFKPFKAEEFKVNEHIRNNMEDFKVPEIQTSTLDETHNNKEDKGIDLQEEINKISQSTTTSATSASAGTAGSIGAAVTTTTVVVVGVVGTGIATGNNILDPEKPEPPPVLPTEPVYGSLKYQKAMVHYTPGEYNPNTSGYEEGTAEIVFVMTGTLNEGYMVELVDKISQKSATLDVDTITLSDLPEHTTSFALNFKDANDEIIQTQDIEVPYYNVWDFSHDIDYPFLVTGNEDGTFNLYCEFISSYEGQYINYLEISSLEDNTHTPLEVHNEIGYSYIENMSIDAINFTPHVYILHEGNEYQYGYDETREIYLNDVYCDISVTDDVMKFSMLDRYKGDINLKIAYPDNSLQNVTIKENELDSYGQINIKLNQIVSNLNVDVTINRQLPNRYQEIDMRKELLELKKGSDYMVQTKTFPIDVKITDVLNVKDIIMPHQQYLLSVDDPNGVSPIIFNFEGRLKDAHTGYFIKVKDEQGNIIAEHNDEVFYNFDEGIIYKTLIINKTYTFEFYLIDDKGSTYVSNLTLTNGKKPPEVAYGDGSIGVYPYGCYITYNSDDTYNIYQYVELYNPDGVDMYYRTEYINSKTNKIDKVALSNVYNVFENIPITNQYRIKVDILQKIGNTYYPLTATYKDEGIVGVFKDDTGYVNPASPEVINLSPQTNLATIQVSEFKTSGPLTVIYSLDDGPQKETIIPNEAIKHTSDIGTEFNLQIENDNQAFVKINFTLVGEIDINSVYYSQVYLDELKIVTKGSSILPYKANFTFSSVM